MIFTVSQKFGKSREVVSENSLQNLILSASFLLSGKFFLAKNFPEKFPGMRKCFGKRNKDKETCRSKTKKFEKFYCFQENCLTSVRFFNKKQTLSKGIFNVFFFLIERRRLWKLIYIKVRCSFDVFFFFKKKFHENIGGGEGFSEELPDQWENYGKYCQIFLNISQ